MKGLGSGQIPTIFHVINLLRQDQNLILVPIDQRNAHLDIRCRLLYIPGKFKKTIINVRIYNIIVLPWVEGVDAEFMEIPRMFWVVMNLATRQGDRQDCE